MADASRRPRVDDASLGAAIRAGRAFRGSLPSEYASAPVGVRVPPLLRDQRLDRGTAGAALKPAGLIIETLQRAQFLLSSQPRLLNRRLQHLDGLIIDADRHRKWMPVLAAVGKGKSRRIAETIGRAMQDLGDHRQGAHGPRRQPPEQAAVRRNRSGRARPPPPNCRADAAPARRWGARRDGPASPNAAARAAPQRSAPPDRSSPSLHQGEFADDPVRPQGLQHLHLIDDAKRRLGDR